MNITNKPAFWTGLAYQFVQLGLIACIGIVLLIQWIDWSWLTFKVGLLIAGGAVVLLYNALSYLLIRLGLKPKK